MGVIQGFELEVLDPDGRIEVGTMDLAWMYALARQHLTEIALNGMHEEKPEWTQALIRGGDALQRVFDLLQKHGVTISQFV